MRTSASPGRAIGYTRVSTEEQATEGVSLGAQERAIRAYCAMRQLELAEVVIDAGVSAGKPIGAREGGSRVLEAVRRREVGAVVGLKLDRLFRDCADCLNVVAGWDKAGVALHLVDLGGQAVDTSSAMGRFFLTVMAGAAELERNQIRERTRTGMAEKKLRQEFVGQTPLGWLLDDDGVHLIPHAEEQGAVRLARGLRAKGRSLRQIAASLGERGFHPRGVKWHVASVMALLKAPLADEAGR